MNEFKSFKFLVPGVLSQKFAKEVGGLSTVIPAEAGIQRFFEVLDSGSPPAFAGVGRNDGTNYVTNF
jgi:hypothetical protein